MEPDTLLPIFDYALLTVDMAVCQKGTSPAEATSNGEKKIKHIAIAAIVI